MKSIGRFAYTNAEGQIIDSDFVFTTTGRTPVSGLSKPKRQLDRLILEGRTKADPGSKPMPNWTYHDLRRTTTTGLAALGVHPHIADAILNHKSGSIKGVAAIYNRYAYLDERRRALEAWETHLLAILKGPKPVDNVIPIATAKDFQSV